MSSSRPKLSEEQWLPHKALIRRLYLVEEMPLDKLVEQLRGHGLHVTTNQLEYKLKKWNFRKNISKDAWVEIDHCISKRKREGKDSEVIFCGKRVKRETVEKETNRHRDRTIFAQLAQLTLQQTSSPVVSADAQVSVCTPQPLSMEFEWPSTLPWLRFPAKDLQSEFRVLKGYRIQETNSSDAVMLSAHIGKTTDNEKIRPKALIPANYLQGGRLATNIAEVGVSKLAAIIGISMPESFPQEHLQRAQCLLSGSREEYLYESLSIVIYALSNNLSNLWEEDQWQKTMTILKTCGLFEIRANLKNLKSWTIDGFIEKLFQAAIDRLDDASADGREIMTVLKWLLALGQSPIIANKEFWRDLLNCEETISAAAKQRHLELMELILEAGGDANSTPLCDDQTLLEIVLNSDARDDVMFRMAQLLLEHGASVKLDQALHSAIRRKRDRELIEMILQNGGNISAELECPSGFVCKETALSVAAATGLSETQYILDLLKSRNPSKPITEFITADVLISAAAAGQYDTVCFLCSKSGIIAANDCGITPLHAAAYGGNLEICQLLFPLHDSHVSDVTPMFSPFHAACYRGHEDVVHFLIEKGANINVVASFGCTDEERRAACRLFSNTDWKYLSELHDDLTPLDMVLEGAQNSSAVGKAVSCAIQLINAGAKPSGREVIFAANHLYPPLLSVALAAGADLNKKNSRGISALQLALTTAFSVYYPIRSGGRDLVDLLFRHGATLQGGEVVSAISTGDWDLVDLLLRHGGGFLDTDRYGTTALEATIHSRHTAGLTRLFNTVAGIYNAGSLCAAIETRQNSIIQQLLTNRRSKPVDHDLEVTAVGIAAESGDLGLLRSLLEHPPSRQFGPLPLLWHNFQRVTSKREEYGPIMRRLWGSPLALLARQKDDWAVEACSKLLKSGFRPDELTWSVASGSNNLTFIQFLLDHDQRYEKDYGHDGSRLKIPGPLITAIKNRNKELVTLLLRAGVDVNEHDSGATALQWAAIKGHLGIAKYLLDLGAQVNALPAESHGRTALEGAAECGGLDMLELLLASGAHKTGRLHRYFVRAVKRAMAEGHHTAANLLKQSLGWSEEDEGLFGTKDIFLETPWRLSGRVDAEIDTSEAESDATHF
ncbi:ankyrin repeat-containing domain protein [Ustulina deusta]|nr:ankyrin repeat-containing domain protein [Ustulina deusta]